MTHESYFLPSPLNLKKLRMKAVSNCYDNVSIRAKIESGEFRAVTKKSRSRVWNVFSRVVDQNGAELKNVICRTCPSVFKFHGSTSNLVRHKCYKNAIGQFVPNKSSRDMKIEKLKSGDSRQSSDDQEFDTEIIDPLDTQSNIELAMLEEEAKEKIAHVLANWSVENCRPFDICEDTGLKKLATLLIEIGANFGCNFKLDELMPQPATVSENIDACYQDVVESVRQEVCAARTNGYSIACNAWTDEDMKTTNLGISIHFVKDGSLFRRLLTATSLDEESCTGSLLRIELERILGDFDCELGEDYPLVVTSTESIRSAVPADAQIHCINYLLNNIVETAFNEVSALKEMLSQAKGLVKYLQKSGMVDYSPKSWNSIYHVLSSIEANWKTNNIEQMCSFNINDISSVVNVLGHFESCCNILHSGTQPTLHLVIPHIHRLRKLCINPSTTKIESKLKHRLTELLEALVETQIGKYHKMAMFLFPPTNQLLQCTQLEKDKTIEECKNLMKRFGGIDNEHSDMEVEIKQELNDDLFSDFLSSTTSEDRIMKEIRRYSDLQVPLSDGYDVLNWWHLNKDNFPLVFRISCRVLGTPATSVFSEKACERTRHLLTDLSCSRVSQHESINKIIFLHKNLNK